MRRKRQSGQAILFVLMALGLVVMGALGLAIDASHLYAQRQMAQAAADAAATAGVMTLYSGTAGGTGGTFGSAGFTCDPADSSTPCVYARTNGFGATAADTVAVEFPASVPGVMGSPDFNPPFVRVRVSRDVNTTLMRFFGPVMSTVQASGTAGIVKVDSPVPVLVTHPTLNGAFRIGGNPLIRICGGAARSIQVNSSSSSALTTGGAATVDLSHAGPADSGNCDTGTGADFAVFGGPSSTGLPSWLSPSGTTQHFVQPAAPLSDPLATVPAPARPPSAPAPAALANGVSGCPASPAKACKLYAPGLYSKVDVKNETAVFRPGLYYIDGGGFGNGANGQMLMATGYNDPVTGDGMVVYNTGSGTFDIGANSSATLKGSPAGSIYKGILFFEDRNAPALTHRLGGGGDLTLEGTVYLNNTTMTASVYQTLLLRGNSGNTTKVLGEVIVGALDLGGGGTIVMQLNPQALTVNQVALVE